MEKKRRKWIKPKLIILTRGKDDTQEFFKSECKQMGIIFPVPASPNLGIAPARG